jgi:GT2 family glycosyltransferase
MAEKPAVVKDSVAILIPCGAPVEPRVLQHAVLLANFSTYHKYPVRQVGVTDRTLIHTARNFLAKEFLETECEWAFWMDSDMILEPRTIVTMIDWAKKLDGKFLTGVYVTRNGEHRPLVLVRECVDVQNRKHKNLDKYGHTFVYPKDCTTPFKVDACGFGCVLTHRSMFEKMKYPYFRNEWYEEDKEVSEDFWFCVKAKEAGFDLWCVPELKCGHLGRQKTLTLQDYKPAGNLVEIKKENGDKK